MAEGEQRGGAGGQAGGGKPERMRQGDAGAHGRVRGAGEGEAALELNPNNLLGSLTLVRDGGPQGLSPRRPAALGGAGIARHVCLKENNIPTGENIVSSALNTSDAGGADFPFEALLCSSADTSWCACAATQSASDADSPERVCTEPLR